MTIRTNFTSAGPKIFEIVSPPIALVVVHNHPSGAMPYPALCREELGFVSGEVLPDAA
ncbi:MAG: hypothetical protein JO170_20900 [Verrucomicrobia bacterium]|nr:hypothetical protein [Verrucomicrobiota bacterium]